MVKAQISAPNRSAQHSHVSALCLVRPLLCVRAVPKQFMLDRRSMFRHHEISCSDVSGTLFVCKCCLCIEWRRPRLCVSMETGRRDTSLVATSSMRFRDGRRDVRAAG